MLNLGLGYSSPLSHQIEWPYGMCEEIYMSVLMCLFLQGYCTLITVVPVFQLQHVTE